MAIFNSYVSLPEGKLNRHVKLPWFPNESHLQMDVPMPNKPPLPFLRCPWPSIHGGKKGVAPRKENRLGSCRSLGDALSNVKINPLCMSLLCVIPQLSHVSIMQWQSIARLWSVAWWWNLTGSWFRPWKHCSRGFHRKQGSKRVPEAKTCTIFMLNTVTIVTPNIT